jgi:Cu/Ag efflux pump CusA
VNFPPAVPAHSRQLIGRRTFRRAVQDLIADSSGRIAIAVRAAIAVPGAILMTAVAFILGVVPLVIVTGPGAGMRQALGTAVFFGMLRITFFGLFFTPVFTWRSPRPSCASAGRAGAPSPCPRRRRRSDLQLELH